MSGHSIDPEAWHGIWKIDRDEAAVTPSGKHLLWHPVFVCHLDGTVSVQLLDVSLRVDASPDGTYRLESHWAGHTLFYRMRASIEVELATFRDGRFEMLGDGIRRLYRHASKEELIPSQQALLDTARAVWK